MLSRPICQKLEEKVETMENKRIKLQQTEEALRKSEETYRSLFEKSRDAILITATDGTFLDVNQAALDLFGYARNELMALNVRKFYADPQDRVQLQKELEQQGFVKDYEVKFQKSDGTEMVCLVSIIVCRDSNGKVAEYQGIVRDITKRKRAEEELKRTSDDLGKTVKKLKDANRQIFEQQKRIVEEERLKVLLQLAGATAQELNQPLTAMLGNIELMKIKEAIPERLAGYISAIEASGKRMAEIVSRVQGVPHYEAKPDSAAARSLISLDQEIAVLAAEDSDEEFSLMVACLKEVGSIKVTRARAIEEAVQLAERGLFDLILSDYVLPDGNALDLLERLQQTEIETPVIVITAHGNEIVASQVIQAGGYDYMPFDLVNKRSLSRSVSNVLEKARLKREIKLAQRKMADMATRDGLTGLFNRRYFLEALEREVARARRYDTGLILCMIDLDHFKRVNDTYGHPAGDMVLREVSTMLQGCFREVDIPCRYGGEEFGVILSNAGGEGARVAAERFRALVAGHQFNYNGMEFQITVSMGIASFAAALNQSAGELIAASDEALYQAKREGRNRIRETYEAAGAKKTVLLVDDEELIVEVGKKLLNHIGYNVLVARSGEEAVDLYETNRGSIEVVLLDMVMPDAGGGRTFDRLRKINPEVKVLLSSGYHVEREVEKLLERGCAGFIKKPFEIAQLSQKIGELLAKG